MSGSEAGSVVVVGAAGRMGMRVSANLADSPFRPSFCESSPAGIDRLGTVGRRVDPLEDAVPSADYVVLAVPDTVLGAVSHTVVPLMRAGAMLVTLDPAAAFAGLLARRDDVPLVVAHPCHPSVFLERTRPEQYLDTFGGVSAPQDVVAALESAEPAAQGRAEALVRVIYGPVLDVHWVTVKQLAVLEPTLVETVTCMVGTLLRDALWETVHTVGVPEAAARAILHGHVQIALTNALRGSNAFSEACEVAIAYGRETIIRDDWKRIFRDDELDAVIARMLRLDTVAT